MPDTFTPPSDPSVYVRVPLPQPAPQPQAPQAPQSPQQPQAAQTPIDYSALASAILAQTQGAQAAQPPPAAPQPTASVAPTPPQQLPQQPEAQNQFEKSSDAAKYLIFPHRIVGRQRYRPRRKSAQ